MKKGIFYGFRVIAVMSILWIISLLLYDKGLQIFLWLSPFVASIVASYSSLKMKFISGLSMSVIFGFFMVFNSVLLKSLGNEVEGYLYGIAALWAFFILSLPVCIVGSLIGIFLVKIKKIVQDMHEEEKNK
jgi:hypothetical protein